MNGTIATTFIVAGVVLEKASKFLLVQEKQQKVYGLWNLPAGRVEVGDTIEKTAVKEAKEETGFTVKLGKKIALIHEEVTKPVIHIFAADIIEGGLHYPEDEILAARWFTLEEIKKMASKLRTQWIIDVLETKTSI